MFVSKEELRKIKDTLSYFEREIRILKSANMILENRVESLEKGVSFLPKI